LDESIEARKADHLQLSAAADVEASSGPGWDDVHLLHEALPEIDQAEIDLSVNFLGTQLSAPLLIAGMTGGHRTARDVNAVLARAAERHGLAMGVCSQRAALRPPDQANTKTVVREHAPTDWLIANLGAPQLIAQGTTPALTLAEIDTAIAMIEANALAIHLNFLQESVQPEGERQARGCADAIQAVVRHLAPLPVIAKETGAGLTRQTALHLQRLGVSALDVGGVGGTSFAAVEGLRAGAQGDAPGARLGEILRDWGVPTPVAIAGVKAAGLPVIATGGMRTGLDAAKAIALGASLVGVARPLLQAALEGDQAVDTWIAQFLLELRTALFLSGSRDPTSLQHQARVITGATHAWLVQLDYV
jgi:isopentenyl-diphosphate delta-isomerase